MDIVSLNTAYQAVKGSLGGISLYGIACIIGVALLLIKFTKAYKTATVGEDGRKYLDVKAFFMLFWKYIICFVVIIVLPVFISVFESGLSHVESAVMDNMGESLSRTLDEAMEWYETEYIKGVENSWGGAGSAVAELPIIKQLFHIYSAITEAYFLFILYLSKYLFYIYASGRYVYLILLELVMPVAIVSALDEKTFPHFITWLKHLMVCYLMIPAFLIANAYAENFGREFLGTGEGLFQVNSSLGFLGLTMILLTKLFLFSFSIKQLYRLI